MKMNLNARRARWMVPVAVTATAGVIAGGVALAGEDSPELEPKDAAELISDVQSAEFEPFSGTVVQTSRLGLPELPGLDGDSADVSPLSLLTGSNTARLWFSSAEQFRFSLMGAFDEVTLIRNDSDVWLWSSETNKADHVTLPGGMPLPGPGKSGTPHPDPQATAEEILDAVEPSTEVSVTGTVEVAGRPAHELTIRPRDEGSLVDEITIAVDGETSRVLRVEVFGDGVTEPAFEIGFTSVSFDEPSEEVYRFNPPPEADVTEHSIAELASSIMNLGEGKDHGATAEPTVIGEGWTSVVVLEDVELPEGDGENDAEAALDALLGSAEWVSGPYGSGHLFSTSLVSALWLDDGTLLFGAVTDDVLEEAAVKAGS
jgi:outer membrane lipoprotein-sorting protein